MKKILLLMALFIALPAFAELTVEDTSSDIYLKNHGHSSAIINAVNKSKAQANGETFEEPIEREEYNIPVVKYFRKLIMYLDPSLDDHSFMNHEIHTAPSYEDL